MSDLYKSNAENKEEAIKELRNATSEELEEIIRLSNAYHGWFVSAALQVISERAAKVANVL